MHYQTEQREKLITLFKEHLHKGFSAREIQAYLKEESISLSAVYRNLKLLEQQGKIFRLSQEGKKEAVYQYRDDKICENRLHTTCLKCGDTFHLEKDIAESISDNLRKDENFSLDKGKTVIYGICKDCL